MAVKAEAKLFREQKTAAKDAHKAKLSARPLVHVLYNEGSAAPNTAFHVTSPSHESIVRHAAICSTHQILSIISFLR